MFTSQTNLFGRGLIQLFFWMSIVTTMSGTAQAAILLDFSPFGDGSQTLVSFSGQDTVALGNTATLVFTSDPGFDLVSAPIFPVTYAMSMNDANLAGSTSGDHLITSVQLGDGGTTSDALVILFQNFILTGETVTASGSGVIDFQFSNFVGGGVIMGTDNNQFLSVGGPLIVRVNGQGAVIPLPASLPLTAIGAIALVALARRRAQMNGRQAVGVGSDWNGTLHN